MRLEGFMSTSWGSSPGRKVKGRGIFYAKLHRPVIVEALEPYHGRILDPAAGSGGMFVQSARFVAEEPDGRFDFRL